MNNKSVHDSQKKRREVMRNSGKKQLATWVNEETINLLKDHQKENCYRLIGYSVDEIVKSFFEYQKS